MTTTIVYEGGAAEQAAIRRHLIGRTVTVTSADTVQLDNGTVLTIGGNAGAQCCASGSYDLIELNGTPNAITAVEFDDKPTEDSYDGTTEVTAGEGHYKIFVFAGHEKINLMTVEGTDGNGCYGTGYWINVEA